MEVASGIVIVYGGVSVLLYGLTRGPSIDNC